jgi:hypothetical protein
MQGFTANEIAMKVIHGQPSPFWSVQKNGGSIVVTFSRTDFVFDGLTYAEILLAFRLERFPRLGTCMYKTPVDWGPCGASPRCHEEPVRMAWSVLTHSLT